MCALCDAPTEAEGWGSTRVALGACCSAVRLCSSVGQWQVPAPLSSWHLSKAFLGESCQPFGLFSQKSLPVQLTTALPVLSPAHSLPLLNLQPRILTPLIFRECGREEGGRKMRDIHVRETHQSVASCTCPAQARTGHQTHTFLYSGGLYLVAVTTKPTQPGLQSYFLWQLPV